VTTLESRIKGGRSWALHAFHDQRPTIPIALGPQTNGTYYSPAPRLSWREVLPVRESAGPEQEEPCQHNHGTYPQGTLHVHQLNIPTGAYQPVPGEYLPLRADTELSLASPVGPQSAHLSRPRTRSATTALRREPAVRCAQLADCVGERSRHPIGMARSAKSLGAGV
jgi:hypothetical protein